jgi:hypothetical protein
MPMPAPEERIKAGLGVCFHKQSGRWLAYLDPKPRRYHGLHPTRDAALAVVEEARHAVA